MLTFILLSLLVAIAALAAVAYPIFARTRMAEPALVSAQEAAEELLAQRDAAFQALRELAFDHRVGKITDEDFAVFEANLKRTAADALRALDEWEQQADAELEPILRAAAKRVAAPTAGGPACPNCGRPAAPGDRFCGNCGKALPALAEPAAPPAAPTCPACGRPSEPGDRFCAGCGRALAV